jgi:hypothetical protein
LLYSRSGRLDLLLSSSLFEQPNLVGRDVPALRGLCRGRCRGIEVLTTDGSRLLELGETVPVARRSIRFRLSRGEFRACRTDLCFTRASLQISELSSRLGELATPRLDFRRQRRAGERGECVAYPNVIAFLDSYREDAGGYSWRGIYFPHLHRAIRNKVVRLVFAACREGEDCEESDRRAAP